MTSVASYVFLELLPPELFVSPGCGCVAAAFVSMPEAAMDEHHRSPFWEHEVRGAWQSTNMKSISETPGEKTGAKYSFRPGVLSANSRHHPAALRSRRSRNGHEYILS
jgi:hypothetical protein